MTTYPEHVDTRRKAYKDEGRTRAKEMTKIGKAKETCLARPNRYSSSAVAKLNCFFDFTDPGNVVLSL